MAPELPNLEWSLPVPSVQELASQRPKSVPERYVRDEIAGVRSDPSLRVPLIDMAKLLDPETHDTELQKLHSACKDWGIFQIINHGVCNESLTSMRNQAREFFELPLKEKERWAKRPDGLEGYGQVFVTSEEQKLDWNDMIFLRTLPVRIRNLSFWPENPPDFRKTLERFCEDTRDVTVSLMKFMATALKLDTLEISKKYQEGIYETKLICYPPCPEPDRVLGIEPHTDIDAITLLIECDDTAGLQALKDDKWVTEEPIDGAIVVNVGNVVEIWSNGIYKSAYHRAIVNELKQRLSIVTFCYPESEIGPAKELTDGLGNQPRYKTVTREEYKRIFYNWKRDAPFIDNLTI